MSTDSFTDKVLLIRDAGAVMRSHTCRTIKERNVAEHSHGVAMLALMLYREQYKDSARPSFPPQAVLAAALVHDLSEIATGDIPAPVKREHPELAAVLNQITTAWEREHGLRFGLSDEEAHLLRWCDNMDFALYTLEEVRFGNRHFEQYLRRIVGWLNGMTLPNIDGNASTAALCLLEGVTTRASNELDDFNFGGND